MSWYKCQCKVNAHTAVGLRRDTLDTVGLGCEGCFRTEDKSTFWLAVLLLWGTHPHSICPAGKHLHPLWFQHCFILLQEQSKVLSYFPYLFLFFSGLKILLSNVSISLPVWDPFNYCYFKISQKSTMYKTLPVASGIHKLTSGLYSGFRDTGDILKTYQKQHYAHTQPAGIFGNWS